MYVAYEEIFMIHNRGWDTCKNVKNTTGNMFFPLLLRLWFLWPDEAGIRNKRSRNRCGCLGGCRFFGGTNMGLDFFKLEELTPSSSSAFSSASTESDMSYGQSLLQPGEWIITKETPKVDGMGKIYRFFFGVKCPEIPSH